MPIKKLALMSVLFVGSLVLCGNFNKVVNGDIVELGDNDFEGWTTEFTYDESLLNVDSVSAEENTYQRWIGISFFPFSRLDLNTTPANPSEIFGGSVSVINPNSTFDPANYTGQVQQIQWEFDFQTGENRAFFESVNLIAIQDGKQYSVPEDFNPDQSGGIIKDSFVTAEDYDSIYRARASFSPGLFVEYRLKFGEPDAFGTETLDFSETGSPITFGFRYNFASDEGVDLRIAALHHKVSLEGVTAVPEPHGLMVFLGLATVGILNRRQKQVLPN